MDTNPHFLPMPRDPRFKVVKDKHHIAFIDEDGAVAALFNLAKSNPNLRLIWIHPQWEHLINWLQDWYLKQ